MNFSILTWLHLDTPVAVNLDMVQSFAPLDGGGTRLVLGNGQGVVDVKESFSEIVSGIKSVEELV